MLIAKMLYRLVRDFSYDVVLIDNPSTGLETERLTSTLPNLINHQFITNVTKLVSIKNHDLTIHCSVLGENVQLTTSLPCILSCNSSTTERNVSLIDLVVAKKKMMKVRSLDELTVDVNTAIDVVGKEVLEVGRLTEYFVNAEQLMVSLFEDGEGAGHP